MQEFFKSMGVERPEYIGDGVYAGLDKLGCIVIATERQDNGINFIVLERSMLEQLNQIV